MTLVIHAPNIHQGGGRSLLTAILQTLPDRIRSIMTLDARMPLPEKMANNVQIQYVPPTLIQRFKAEKWLANNVVSGDVVLCFGNLPPLFKSRGHAVVFVQNRYLVENAKLANLSFKTKLRLQAERFWLLGRVANADEFVVQTPTMKRLLEARTKGRIPVRILPFMTDHGGYIRSMSHQKINKEKKFDFLYVASGEPHKNHRQLIEAWCLLAKEGLFPSMKLTVNEAHFAEVCFWMEQKIEQCRLNVENAGSLSNDQITQFYNQAGALIYPSTFESFGLPLIEARQAGLPVLASELDYVRDVLDPEQTFDPQSAVSIARAVKRFLGIEEQPLPLQDAAGFMNHILERVK